MTFAWPLYLVLLVAAPAALAAYALTLRRRRKQAVTYSSVALLKSVLPKRARWRRHIPVGLLVAALAALAVGAARPQVTRDVPVSRTSIILALDVSRSMCSTDVDPNRLAVAQRAARDFVNHQARGTRTGLVVFSGFAEEAVPPTADRGTLTKAIDGLTTGAGTAIGAAILKSLDAIAEVNSKVKPVGDLALGDAPPPAAAKGAGGYVPDIVVLLTDGANTRGIAPLDAVPYAVDRKVRVYAIGFGTTNPAEMSCTSAQLGGADFGDGGAFRFGGSGGLQFGGNRSPLRADQPTLQQIADQTGGVAYTAENASQLRTVFDSLPKDVTTQHERREITSWFVFLGALFAAAAVAASIRWSPYP